MNVCPAHLRNVIHFFHLDARAAQSSQQFVIIPATQSGVRFAGWMKRFLNSNVNVNLPAGEPDATALGQQRRLNQLLHAKNLAVEAPRFCLAACRGGKLYVIDRRKWR